MWNHAEHLEAYFGIPLAGATLHTLNLRLHPDEIAYIANDAKDRFLIVDDVLVPLYEKIVAAGGKFERVFVVRGGSYEQFRDNAPDVALPVLAETDALGVCYTSGTTGKPKGVVYSHRSSILHTLVAAMPDSLGISRGDVLLPVVPMFHVNAWSLPYSCTMVGAKMVFPGPHLDGKSVYELFENEGVTFTAGVPTVWLALLQHMQANKLKLSTLKYAVIGGSAAPPAMIETFDKEFGVEVLHAWGMSEMSPLGSVNHPKAKHARLSADELLAVRLKQGRPPFGVDMKIVDDAGNELPRDGKAFGDLLVRGPWITKGYFKGEGGEILNEDGWFPTGDVATLDADGYMQITDRSKDVIKSGGEWISSIDLENAAMAHPGVAEAAVIGIRHPKWDERPLLIVVKRPDADVTKADLLKHLEGKIAKWWMPDDVQFIDQIPHGATGKILKTALRDQFKAYSFPNAAA
jgi:fatty-acyl-CoA synthase